MSELSDYRRMIEGPMIASYEDRIKALVAENNQLREAAKASEQPDRFNTEHKLNVSCTNQPVQETHLDEKTIYDFQDWFANTQDGYGIDYSRASDICHYFARVMKRELVAVDDIDVEIAIAEAIAVLPPRMVYHDKGEPVLAYLKKHGWVVMQEKGQS